MIPGTAQDAARSAAEALRAIEMHMLAAERSGSIGDGPNAPSARNLTHYLALREADARPLQDRLRGLGLSSLGRAEACALATVRAAATAAEALAGASSEHRHETPLPVSIDEADALRDARADGTLGPCPPGRGTRIMVTLPTSAAHDTDLPRELLAAGMDIARINAAHDEPDDWDRMITNVRRAEGELSQPHTRIHLDLAGPNPRTGPMPGGKARLRVHTGDRITLAADAASTRTKGRLRLACTLPEVFAHAEPGQRLYFDDGRIVCAIDAASPDALELRVLDAGPEGTKLGAGKGINLPDTDLALPSLMPADLEALDYVARTDAIDTVGLSFVRSADDIRACASRLPEHVALVAKIETRAGFESLPEILLALLERPAGAVMIARGDLAVEVGVERLAEAQEEILWLCEAAHAPVIWATQVLERLAKNGRASRAEITDAAMAGRAECVMLNKGQHITRAVRTLDDILRRMQDHQSKKRAMLRPLGLARRFAMRSGV